MNSRRSASIFFALSLLSLAAGRYLLTIDQLAPAILYPADDLLFVNWAASIAAGEWLGPFRSLTLGKYPGYAVWIAACAQAGIPLLTAQLFVRLISASIVASIARTSGARRLTAVAAFAIVLYSPEALSFSYLRLNRDAFSAELALMTGAAICLLLTARRSGGLLGLALLSLGTGAMSIVREESVWLWAMILPAGLFTLVRARVGRLGARVVWLAMVLIVPALATACAKACLRTMNMRYYSLNVTSLSDPLESPFLDARRAMSSIGNGRIQGFGGIRREELESAYAVSPSLAALKPEIDRQLAAGYTGDLLHIFWSPSGEAATLSFNWVLLSAAAIVDEQFDGRRASQLWKDIAAEIDAACAAKRIVCEGAGVVGMARPALSDVPAVTAAAVRHVAQLLVPGALTSGSEVIPVARSAASLYAKMTLGDYPLAQRAPSSDAEVMTSPAAVDPAARSRLSLTPTQYNSVLRILSGGESAEMYAVALNPTLASARWLITLPYPVVGISALLGVIRRWAGAQPSLRDAAVAIATALAIRIGVISYVFSVAFGSSPDERHSLVHRALWSLFIAVLVIASSRGTLLSRPNETGTADKLVR